MSNRRRLLLSYLANSFKFLPYSYEYLYYGLVPTTIDSKQVRNKAKVSKLYGNSVVENQLIQPTKPTETQNGITITNNGDGSFTLTGTATATVYFVFLYGTWTDHYYLFKGINYPNNNVRWYDVYYGIYASNKDFIFRNTNSSYTQLRASIRIESGTDFTNSPFTFFPQLIDLTQKYPFDTPTTLTDNRVQAILNRGYIPFNLGELKSVDIGEIRSEPYNLFDGELEIGSISTATGENQPSSSVIRSTNYTKVVGGRQYTIRTTDNYNAVRIYQYDENHVMLDNSVAFDLVINYTLLQNTRYVRFVFAVNTIPTNPQIYFYETSAGNLGYKPHTAPQTIPFKYQGGGVGTAHDTYELTKTSHVFTKKQAYTDLNKLTFSKYTSGSNWLFYANVSGGRSGLGADVSSNMLCDKYMTNPLTQGGTATASGDDKTATWDANNSQILIKDTSYANVSDFQSVVSGTLEYQLATPQVITIPRKHLGIVDLGSLNWTYDSANQRFYGYPSNIKTGSARTIPMYCNLYQTKMNGEYYDINWNMVCYKGGGAEVYFHNHTYNNAIDFKNAMNGILLFYETENEVADITDTFDIESGGTINTDSNVLPNADFLMKGK